MVNFEEGAVSNAGKVKALRFLFVWACCAAHPQAALPSERAENVDADTLGLTDGM